MPYSETIGHAIVEAARANEPQEFAEFWGLANDLWCEVGVGDYLVRIEADEKSVDITFMQEGSDLDGIPSQMRWSAETSVWGLVADAAEDDDPVHQTAVPLIAAFVVRAIHDE